MQNQPLLVQVQGTVKEGGLKRSGEREAVQESAVKLSADSMTRASGNKHCCNKLSHLVTFFLQI